MSGAEKKERIPPNLRAMMILEVIAETGRPMSVTELNTSLGLPKSTISRLCRTLVNKGILIRDLSSRRLRPARRLRTICSGLLAASHTHFARHQVLEALSQEIGETCNIVLPEAEGMLYIDRVETHWPLRIQLPVSSHAPFYCTASGKLFLATYDDGGLDKMLATLKLEKLAPNTFTDPASLRTEIMRVRDAGYGEDNEEFIDGLVAVAVPIHDPNGRQFAAVAFHAPKIRVDIVAARRQVPRLKQAAGQLAEIIFDT